MEKWFAEDLPNWVKLAEKSLPAGPGPSLDEDRELLRALLERQQRKFIAASRRAGSNEREEGSKADGWLCRVCGAGAPADCTEWGPHPKVHGRGQSLCCGPALLHPPPGTGRQLGIGFRVLGLGFRILGW